jgi:hypothetical protein
MAAEFPLPVQWICILNPPTSTNWPGGGFWRESLDLAMVPAAGHSVIRARARIRNPTVIRFVQFQMPFILSPLKKAAVMD